MFTLRNAIGMRLEDIQEEKKHLREMIKQLTKEQHDLISRLERLENYREDMDTTSLTATLTDSDSDIKGMDTDIPTDIVIEKTTNKYLDNATSSASKNEYVIPTEPEAYSQDGSKSMSYKELTQILIKYAKEHNNQVDHKEFEQYLIDQYNFTPVNFSHIIWRARKEDPRLRSLISGSRKITILDHSVVEK
ncbi:hypothetical protein [Thalassobacillus pellis]|uniref:hypothetical protein n=1 Tax=Thalassobacillus pellis TaxID=748008 RepID=UPI001960A78B|nr:hypothetical protein [Thalassobacillus pellis]MBM7553330.1 uncharacterized protein (UPF0335 family) [Thalassobacillus pellis]